MYPIPFQAGRPAVGGNRLGWRGAWASNRARLSVPYQILSLLGAGGMGEVYRARDPRLERDVAVKTIAASLAGEPDALARFQREARAIAALSTRTSWRSSTWVHSGVGTCRGAAGGRDARAAATRGKLRGRKRSRLRPSSPTGLAAAHAHRVVHRDLKPDNIFLTPGDRIKILDFGLARRTAPARAAPVPGRARSSRPGSMLVYRQYMSPEQVQGLVPDARSDIFALGCVLHEMLSGRRLFQRGATPRRSPRS